MLFRKPCCQRPLQDCLYLMDRNSSKRTLVQQQRSGYKGHGRKGHCGRVRHHQRGRGHGRDGEASGNLLRSIVNWSGVEFSNGGCKNRKILPKNQHTHRKLLNFENWPQKFSKIRVLKVNYFNLLRKKEYLKLKSWLNYDAIIAFY